MEIRRVTYTLQNFTTHKIHTQIHSVSHPLFKYTVNIFIYMEYIRLLTSLLRAAIGKR